MVSWNIFKRNKAEPFEDTDLARQLRIEGGFQRIQGTSHLRNRIEFSQTPFIEMQRQLEHQIKKLYAQDNRTEQDEALIMRLNRQLFTLSLHKTNKTAASAFSASKDDRDMSKRYSALEKLFVRNWQNPSSDELLIMAELFMLDISFSEEHQQPAPHILVQTQIGGGGRISLDSFLDKEKKGKD